MAAVLLPGTNTLTLCGSALMQIVQEHLRASMYGGRDEAKPRVTAVKYVGDNATFEFTVTTDPVPEGAPGFKGVS